MSEETMFDQIGLSDGSFDWIGLAAGVDDRDAYVRIHPVTEHAPGRVVWEITFENIDGITDGTELDDDAVSAWSTVAYVMCSHGATGYETTEMVQAAPEHLDWCFDGQVGMYAYDKNEEWDG